MKVGHLEGEQPDPSGTYTPCFFHHLPTGMILQVVPMLLMVQTSDESRNGCKKPVVPKIEHIDIIDYYSMARGV